MLLETTSQKIQAFSDTVATTTNPEVVVDWQDLTTPGVTPGTSNIILNGITAVDIVAAPASGGFRTVKNISIYNADTVPHTITVQYNDGGTIRILVSQPVAVGETLEYVDGEGWDQFGVSLSLTPLPTRQVLTSGSSATYTTPANARQIRIRMVGGGGGGAGTGSSGQGSGGAGGNTIFNSVNAAGGGGGGANSVGGASGTGGTGTASFRTPGGGGVAGFFSATGTGQFGGIGGSTLLGGSAAGNTSSVANTGAGGNGGFINNLCTGGGGGGGGEYVEIIINSPSATYTYTIGAAGSGGSLGSSGAAGNAGGTGVIIVDEFY